MYFDNVRFQKISITPPPPKVRLKYIVTMYGSRKYPLPPLPHGWSMENPRGWGGGGGGGQEGNF